MIVQKRLTLMVAPPAMQPGGYVMTAYADRATPYTRQAELALERSARGFLIDVAWDCATARQHAGAETDRFVDACALMAPVTADAPWLTMGAPAQPVEAVYWRADREAPWRMRAEGLGTMQRGEAPAAWSARGEWTDGRWRVRFALDNWEPLVAHGRLALAIWSGQHAERGGLKSVTTEWLPVG